MSKKLPPRLKYVPSRVKGTSYLLMNENYDEPIELPTSARGETLTDVVGESMLWHSSGFDGFGGDLERCLRLIVIRESTYQCAESFMFLNFLTRSFRDFGGSDIEPRPTTSHLVF